MRTFATTFLGHQGWLFRTERACVAVDPLLCEPFGAQHALDYQVFPPRRLDLARFPALDAVVLTHEHDDHFDIPSLAKLSRKIPIHLSALVERGARDPRRDGVPGGAARAGGPRDVRRSRGRPPGRRSRERRLRRRVGHAAPARA